MYKVINFYLNGQFYIAEIKLFSTGTIEIISVHEEHDSIPVSKITEDMAIAIRRVLSTSTS